MPRAHPAPHTSLDVDCPDSDLTVTLTVLRGCRNEDIIVTVDNNDFHEKETESGLIARANAVLLVTEWD
jgi:hypothetical protein